MTGYVIPAMLATPAELTEWMGGDQSASAATLRSCTTMVFDRTRGAAYDVATDTGLATDTNTLAALRDATLIQAAAWITLGISPFTGGIDMGGVKKSKKIGTASFDIAGAEATAAAKAYAATNLVPEAEARLRQQNLIIGWPASS